MEDHHDHDDHHEDEAQARAEDACRTCSESPLAHQRAVASRRTFLRAGLGGLVGLGLGVPFVSAYAGGTGVSTVHAALDAELAGATGAPAGIKSIIVLWMDGGPSQFDTLDPKPGTANGGGVKAIATAIPGVQIASTLERTAAILDRLAVIRCMDTREGNHARARTLLHTGFAPNPTVAYPSLGSIVAYERGAGDFPIPEHVSINSPGYRAGALGLAFDPFFVRDARQPVDNLPAPKGLADARQERRLAMLARANERFKQQLGGESFQVDGSQAVMESARRFMRAEEAAAFELSGEPAAVRAAYGDNRFGQGCLMARRLVEAGVKFVEVNLGGWDTHADNEARVAALAEQVDGGLATLVTELEQRDLLKSTLVVWMGEFGRTPKINNNGGRDHFPRGWSMALGGGGIRGGQVLGETTADGEIRGRSISAGDLFRTVLTLSGIDPDTRYYTSSGRPVKYADTGNVIKELVGAPGVAA